MAPTYPNDRRGQLLREVDRLTYKIAHRYTPGSAGERAYLADAARRRPARAQMEIAELALEVHRLEKLDVVRSAV